MDGERAIDLILTALEVLHDGDRWVTGIAERDDDEDGIREIRARCEDTIALVAMLRRGRAQVVIRDNLPKAVTINPPGWYRDPDGGDYDRWWGGLDWTEMTRPGDHP